MVALKVLLMKLAIGVAAPFVLGGIKALAPGMWEKVPAQLRPLLSGLLGAILSGGSSVVTDTLGSVAVDAAAGALGGSVGRDARDAWAQHNKAPDGLR